MAGAHAAGHGGGGRLRVIQFSGRGSVPPFAKGGQGGFSSGTLAKFPPAPFTKGGENRQLNDPEDDWRRLQAGDGTTGPRWDDWHWLALAAPERSDGRRWLVVRRSLRDPTERTAYIVYAPATTTLATVVSVIGRRWTMEQCFEEAQGEVGLDQYAVRHWTGWYRHITLAKWAYALLTVLRAAHVPLPLP